MLGGWLWERVRVVFPVGCVRCGAVIEPGYFAAVASCLDECQGPFCRSCYSGVALAGDRWTT